MPRKFYTLDVFTNQPIAGNPLAVVLDSEGLDDASMQAIAVEFNLSETVFVSPAVEAEKGAAIRIFTPAHELPFAGHPTIGTALLLNQLNHFGVEDDFVLEEKVGPVRCVISESNGKKTARFGLPKIATLMDHPFDTNGWANALGLDAGRIDGAKGSLWNGGVPYTMVPVISIEDVAAVQIDMSHLRQVEPVFDGIASNPYVFCKGGEAPDTDFHARMFAPLFGIPEDPATGSAVASMSGWIAQHEMANTEKRTFKIEQGYEMGRPSQIYLDIEKVDGAIVKAGISGSAVIISDGVLHI
ncbi:MAG: PhzF family phenazine biosynthesis protein [Rhizobiaceae bacterium]|nr:PhzF family phenazine biosynthesis protein [Rhizobiaceae bacterium]